MTVLGLTQWTQQEKSRNRLHLCAITKILWFTSRYYGKVCYLACFCLLCAQTILSLQRQNKQGGTQEDLHNANRRNNKQIGY